MSACASGKLCSAPTRAFCRIARFAGVVRSLENTTLHVGFVDAGRGAADKLGSEQRQDLGAKQRRRALTDTQNGRSKSLRSVCHVHKADWQPKPPAWDGASAAAGTAPLHAARNLVWHVSTPARSKAERTAKYILKPMRCCCAPVRHELGDNLKQLEGRQGQVDLLRIARVALEQHCDALQPAEQGRL